jgi:hypothetical protein
MPRPESYLRMVGISSTEAEDMLSGTKTIPEKTIKKLVLLSEAYYVFKSDMGFYDWFDDHDILLNGIPSEVIKKKEAKDLSLFVLAAQMKASKNNEVE